MKRPIFIAVIGYIFGIIGGLYLKLSIVLFIFIIYFVLSRLKKTRRYLKIYISKNTKKIFIVAFIISYITVCILNNKYNTLYNNIGEDKFIGTIISDVKEKEHSIQYTILVESIGNNKKYKGTRVIANIKKDKNLPDLSYGDKITINGTYIKPIQARNYKGFDYKEYLKSIKVYGMVNTKANQIKIIKKNNTNILAIVSNKIRAKVKNNTDYILPEKTKDLFLGILLGYTDEIEEKTKEDFKNSSLYHMLAVSGAHVSYLILGITLILKKLSFSKYFSKFISIISLIFFMYMTGMSPSVVRACLMAIIMLFSGIMYRKLDVINSISLSFLIILIDNPFNINNMGLILSYGGTIGIITFYNIIKYKISKNKKNRILVLIQDMAIVTISAQLIILPITIINFNTLSLTFLISNILAGSLMGIITIGGLFIISISFISIEISKIICIPFNLILELLINIAKYSSQIPFSKIYLKTPNIVIVLFYYFLLYLIYHVTKLNIKKDLRYTEIKVLKKYKSCIYKVKKNTKKIIIVIIILAICLQIWKAVPKNLRIYFIDVGQGDSTLVVTPSEKNILIDGGGSRDRNSFDVGESTLVPYLLDRGITNLDYIMISHFDSDHCNGTIAVIEKLVVKNVIISKQSSISNEYTEIMQKIKRRNINIIIVKEGQKIKLDNYVYMNILNPSSELIQDNTGGLNNNSIVSKLVYNNFSILFTGDIEEISEKNILQRYSENAKKELRSTIMKIAHHGSKTSTTQEFLEVASPKIALIGVGENNTFRTSYTKCINAFTRYSDVRYLGQTCVVKLP